MSCDIFIWEPWGWFGVSIESHPNVWRVRFIFSCCERSCRGFFVKVVTSQGQNWAEMLESLQTPKLIKTSPIPINGLSKCWPYCQRCMVKEEHPREFKTNEPGRNQWRIWVRNAQRASRSNKSVGLRCLLWCEHWVYSFRTLTRLIMSRGEVICELFVVTLWEFVMAC